MKFLEYRDNAVSALKEVYSKPLNGVFSGALFLSFLTLNLFIFQYIQLGSLIIEQPLVFFKSYLYTLTNLPFLSIVSTLLLSLLSGVLIVMLIYGYRKNMAMSAGKKGAAGASGSILVGLLAPACPSCGIGVLSALGLGGLGAVLPFGGQEIGVFGVIILIASIVYASKQIVAPVCKIKKKR